MRLNRTDVERHSILVCVYLKPDMLRRASWSRFLALLLLFWGMCDLAVPGLCKSDFADSAAVAAKVKACDSLRISHPGALQVAQQSQDRTPSPAVPSSDSYDCWCCCSHIVPAPFASALVVPPHISDHPPLSLADNPRWRAVKLFQPPKI